LQELQHQDTKAARTRKLTEELRAAIAPELLRSFDHAAEQGRVAVAVVTESGACGGGHLKLPFGWASTVQVWGEQIHNCPHCGCILYSPGALGLVGASKHPRARSSDARRSIVAVRPGAV